MGNALSSASQPSTTSTIYDEKPPRGECYSSPVRAPSTATLLILHAVVCASCAGVGEAVVGSCLAATLQLGAQVCVDVCVEAACDSMVDAACDGDDAPPLDPPPEAEAHPEIPPDAPDAAPPATCRWLVDDGGADRVACVDGSTATALPALANSDAPPALDAAAGRTVDGDVVVDDLGDVARLSGVYAVTGTLRVDSAVLLRVRLPSLRSVGGDVVVAHNPRLVRLELPALVDVGGQLVVQANPALSADPVPALARAAHVDVVDNDALPTTVVDRLLGLPD